MSKWKIEYDNDIGPSEDGYSEWWCVTDGNRSYQTNSEEDARWLCDALTRGEETK